MGDSEVINDFEKEKILLLIKLDSERLFDRIVDRFDEYMQTFSMKRIRTHFRDIFFSRYSSLQISDLKKFSSELIVALDTFYTEVNKYEWYLNHTEDMPSAARDQSERHIRNIKINYDTLKLYIEAELDIQKKFQELKSES